MKDLNVKILIFPFLLIMFSCSLTKKSGLNLEKEPPYPGTIEIGKNLFIDEQEITNFNWCEYMYWTRGVYGDSSDKYKACKVDSDLWLAENNCLSNIYADYYLQHPDYRDYPLVTITQKQAKDFLNWRSERVFEWILIKHNIIEAYGNQTDTNHFSRENYFSGNYNGYVPDTTISYYYPTYRLPTESEWLQGENYVDSLNQTHKIKACKKKYCDFKVEKNSMMIVYNAASCKEDSIIGPMERTYCEKNWKVYFHWHGNVSEWLNEENKIIGGNWKDTTMLHFNESIPANAQSATTIGFRAICEMKKYVFKK